MSNEERALYTAIGRKITRLRVGAAVSQRALAGFLGISAPALAKWESGEVRCPLSALVRMARHFRVRIESLIPESFT
jgi:transcriptional regulator with XRE-family HTH domain